MKLQNQTNSKNAGFTLIEITIAIFAFVVLCYGLIILVSSILSSAGKQGNLLSDSDQARKVAFGIVDELRRAQRGGDGSYNLFSGGVDSQTLTFFTNLDTSPDIEKVRYFSQNGKLYKGVTKFASNVYDSAKEQIFVVQDNLANGSDPIFTYFDGNYDGVNGTALPLPIDVKLVKFVQVNLKIYNKGGVANTNFYVVSAGSAIRDLKNNLGQ